MSVLSWFDGKQGPEFETARWVHDHMEDRIRAGDVVGLAEQCVALKPVNGVFCGIMLAGFQGRDEVLRDALEELQSAVRTMPDAICERVFAIIERGNLAIHLSTRREQYETSRANQLDATIETIRAQLASCEPRQLVAATTALLHKQPTVFDLALPITLIARADLAELGLARIRELLAALPDDECQAVIDTISASGLRVDTRAKATELAQRRQLAALAADAGTEPRHLGLEAALEADVDDVAGYAVLGDFLHDHPRGELIALQLEAETEPSLTAVAQAYLETHADALLGSLAAHRYTRERQPRPAFTWRRGFIDRIRIAIEYLDEPGDPTSAQLLHRAFAHPAGRLIRGVEVTSSDHSGSIDDLIDVIANHQSGVVQEVFLDVRQRDDYSGAGNIEALWRVPQLRSVRVRGAMVDLGTIAHPLLEHVELTAITAAHLRAIASAHWPRIRQLEIGSTRRNSSELDDLQILLARRDLPELAHLGVFDTEATDDICQLVVNSPLAAQLRVLDISSGSMTDFGAETLVRSALPNLETLVVSDNALSPTGIATLRAAFHHVVADGQLDPDDYDV